MLKGPIAQKLVTTSHALALATADDALGLLSEAALILDALVASSELENQLHEYLEDARLGRAVPIEDGKQGEIVMYRDSQAFISLASYAHSAKVLHTHPVRGVFKVLAGVPFEIIRYRLPDDWDVVDPRADSELVEIGTTLVRPGDSIVVDGAREVAWFKYASRVVVAKCIVPIYATHSWAFDPINMRLLDPECADSRLDALVHSLDLLRAIGSPSSLDSLKIAAQHPAHFVRWSAIKAAAYIDRMTGIELLRAALDDKHRLIREAAQRTLNAQGGN